MRRSRVSSLPAVAFYRRSLSNAIALAPVLNSAANGISSSLRQATAEDGRAGVFCPLSSVMCPLEIAPGDSPSHPLSIYPLLLLETYNLIDIFRSKGTIQVFKVSQKS